MIRVVVADDARAVRQALAALLDHQPDLTVVGQACNGSDAVEQVAALEPDVVVMDMNMPVMNGIEATRVIVRQYPHVRVVGVTLDAGSHGIERMIDAGAAACLRKDASVTRIIAEIRRVAQLEHERYTGPDTYSQRKI